MKKFILLALLFSGSVFAGSSGYRTSMTTEFDKAWNPSPVSRPVSRSGSNYYSGYSGYSQPATSTTYYYDSQGRVVGRAETTGDTTVVYDADGQKVGTLNKD